MTILRKWSGIADYLGVSIGTAKRYKKKYGLPVRHLPGGQTIMLIDDLKEWIRDAKWPKAR